jgi:hypothetical protein
VADLGLVRHMFATPTKRRVSGLLKFVPLLLLAIVGAAILYSAIMYHYASPYFQRRFVRQWSGVFGQCKTLDDIKRLPPKLHPEWIYIRQFTDGSWLAASSTSPSDNGADYFASVFRDSRGRISTADHDFDGYEGLAGDISDVKANSLDEFYANSSHLHLIEQSTR